MDASALIHAWKEDYSPDIFPSLYIKLEEFPPQNVILLKEIMDEIQQTDSFPIGNFKGNLNQWIEKKTNIKIIENSNVIGEGRALQNIYEPIADEEDPDGVSENDTILIAHAKKNGYCIVTEEAKQKNPPTKKSNYKIPLVCKDEGVQCMNLVEFFRACQIRI